MSRRAAAAAATRDRIVHATLELHGEQGIARTSYDDIAARAGVGVGTVYRHFPSLDDLIPACGAVTRRMLDLPTPAIFEGLTAPAERIARRVGEVFAIYERGAPQLRAIRDEAGTHPDVAEAGAEVEAALGALVDAAVKRDRAVVRAMVDLHTWEAFRSQGLSQAETIAAVSDLLLATPRPA